jgi:glycosyltransferase involved in cell wall biosynthesis
MTSDTYPGVLIFGHTPGKKSGAGITTFNLFSDWPKEKLAAAAPLIKNSDFDICNNFYKLGFDEERSIFPFNLIQRKTYSGPFNPGAKKPGNTNSETRLIEEKKSFYGKRLKKLINNLLHFTGLYYFIYRLHVSEKFLAWFDSFSPDIIYTHLSKYEHIVFLNQLSEIRKIKVVVHITDDFPMDLPKAGILYFYWKNKIQHGYRDFFKECECRLSICKEMSEEYFRRYNLSFYPFFNGIDLDKWQGSTRKSWEKQGNFSILYAGRIGRGMKRSLFRVMKVIDRMGKKDYQIELKLQSGKIPGSFQKFAAKSEFIKINPFVEYSSLPQTFSKADVMIIPMDFRGPEYRFIRLSMPTKVPEYMISGTPVLVFASKLSALAQYALEKNWAMVVTENSEESLMSALDKLYNQAELRQEIAERAVLETKQYHDLRKVRSEFLVRIREAAEASKRYFNESRHT